ncbi:hypothetical protein Tco_0214916 [Tanacetum coccineum]
MLQQNNKLENMLSNYFQMNKPSGSGSGPLPSNTVNNPKGDLKAITTRSGVSYDGPPIPPPFSPSPKVVEREPERKLLLPELNPTQMILELADQSTSRPIGIAEDVFVRVGKRPFLRTARALIDVYGEELTLRVGDEAITFKVACEEYSQEVLGFFGNSESGNPTPISESIIAKSPPSLTPFEGGDFILEKLKLKNADVSLPEYECFYSEGDIRLLEKFLNNDPSSPLPPKKIKTEELKSGTDKLPVIIAKDLKDDEKERLIKIGDFKPAVQHQRMVNPKIHEVIKKEVVKLLDAGLIYPISDSPWVSPVHCVPKKGGMTIVKNEDNELIPTRCMMAIFHDMIEETMEVFMDDFSVFGDSFSSCLSHLDKMLQRIEVDSKVDVIAKLPPPTSVKGI